MYVPANTEDKLAWCNYGAQMERQFVADLFGSGVGVVMNPDKRTNPYTNDLLGLFQADLKSISTPFRTADRYGFDPQFAITINEKDIDRYTASYPNIILFLHIRYPEYSGIRIATIYRLNKFIQSGKAKKHQYLHRANDTAGNAKASYIFDLRWFDELQLNGE